MRPAHLDFHTSGWSHPTLGPSRAMTIPPTSQGFAGLWNSPTWLKLRSWPQRISSPADRAAITTQMSVWWAQHSVWKGEGAVCVHSGGFPSMQCPVGDVLKEVRGDGPPKRAGLG